MRQPLQRDSWDSSSDPKFRTPKSFDDDEEKNGNKQNNNWWSSKQQRRGGDGLLLASSKTATGPDVVFDNRQSSSISSVLPASTEAGSSASSSAFEEQELDLFQRSVDTLDFPIILSALRRQCFTLPARQMVDEAAVQTHHLPQQDQDQEVQSLIANNPHETRKRYKAVLEMQHLLSAETITTNLRGAYYKNRRGIQVTIGQGNPPPLEGLSFDIESILKIISEDGEVLEGPDILEISTMINAMEDLQLWSRGLERIIDDSATSEMMTNSRREGEENLSSSPLSSPLFVEIPHIVDGIKLNTTLQNLLEEAFDDEGKLSGKTFPFLGQLRAKVRTMKADILQTLDSIVQLPSIKSKLALESGGPLISEVASSNGAGRLVLPINPKYASALGIVHDSSRSGKTVYVEPSEIVGPTNDLRVVERELEAEEARVWRLLTEQVWNNQRDLRASVQAVAQLDLCVARYMLGQRLEGVIPDVQDEGIISLRNAKHPVLLLRKMEKVVGSDISLGVDGKQGLVLTGPNSGGKTLILKLLGLLALMSRSGIPIPAEHGDMDGVYQPRVDFFDPVLADIGDIQSVDSDLSTFSGHMYICREVLALTKGGKNSLVLMDELGSGTDPNQGVAIAQALLEALLDTGCRVVITTHYMALKQLASSDDRFSVAGMQFVGGRPTYKLLPGVVGESYALAVAERLQLPQSVLDRANELLDSETRQMGDLISDLEDQKLLIDEQVVEIEERKKEIGAMEYKMKEKLIQMEKKMLTARRDEARKFAKKLEQKEQILEDILDKLKSDPSRKVITQSWESIKFVKRDAINEAENVPSVLKKKKNAAKAMKEAIEELVPLAEIRNRPLLNEGDKLQVCKTGNLFGREATVIKDTGKQIQVIVSGLSVKLKHTELSKVLTVDGIESKRTAASGRKSPGMSKAVEKALKSEIKGGNSSLQVETKKASTSLAMRTDGNTVDVRGCNLEGALEEVTRKIGECNLNGHRSVYILHGHGSGGVLKSKLRDWLKTEKRLIKKWAPADMSDGGDAFTRIEL
ncbi:MAG: DNA mismatch repair protein MutS2 [Bacillariaceae sp.]|jgi:DNA mismatch repair protein MutS2